MAAVDVKAYAFERKNHVCLCFLLTRILRTFKLVLSSPLYRGATIAIVLVRLGCFGRGSADCPFSGQRTWDTPSDRGLYI